MNPRLAVSQGLLLCTGGKGNALCAHLCAPIRDLALFSGCVFPRYCESPLQYVIARLCFNTSLRGSARAVAIFNRRSLGDCHASLAMTCVGMLPKDMCGDAFAMMFDDGRH